MTVPGGAGFSADSPKTETLKRASPAVLAFGVQVRINTLCFKQVERQKAKDNSAHFLEKIVMGSFSVGVDINQLHSYMHTHLLTSCF